MFTARQSTFGPQSPMMVQSSSWLHPRLSATKLSKACSMSEQYKGPPSGTSVDVSLGRAPSFNALSKARSKPLSKPPSGAPFSVSPLSASGWSPDAPPSPGTLDPASTATGADVSGSSLVFSPGADASDSSLVSSPDVGLGPVVSTVQLSAVMVVSNKLPRKSKSEDIATV